MPPTPPSAPPVWASPWAAALGVGLAALGLAKALGTDGPDVGLVLLGLFLTALSAHARLPEGDRRRRPLEAAMLVLLAGQLAAAFA